MVRRAAVKLAQWDAHVRRVVAALGADLVDVRAAERDAPTLVVLGTGAGITMAALDALAECYPGAGLIGCDMAGHLGAEARVTIVDYVTSAWPTLLLIWSSLRDATPMAHALAARRESTPTHGTWLYLRGYGEQNAAEWHDLLGCTIVDDLWAASPLPGFMEREGYEHA